MGIESKHQYRFVYLRSEKWDNVRLEALVRDGAKCAICGEISIHNDAHHIWYPDSFWDTTKEHLIILCRPCHELTHAIIGRIKNEKAECCSVWKETLKSIRGWRQQKLAWLYDPTGLKASPKALRDAYEELKAKSNKLEMEIKALPKPPKSPDIIVTIEGQHCYVPIRVKKPGQIVGKICDLCHSTDEVSKMDWSNRYPGEKFPQAFYCVRCANNMNASIVWPESKGKACAMWRKFVKDNWPLFTTDRKTNDLANFVFNP